MSLDLKNPKPFYLQIIDDIKMKISSGQLKIGEKIGSQQELSRAYDVSLITIKKAIAELINQNVLFSRVGKGTYVANRPSTIDLSRHKTIGVVLSDLKNPFFSLIINSIEAKASEFGYNILLSNSADHADKEDTVIRHFLSIGVDGLIIASLSHMYRASSTIRELKNDDFPFIMVSYIEDKDVYFVGTDHEKGAYMATEHLIQAGYNQVGYISGEEGNLLGKLREKGYLRAMKKYDKEINQNFIFRSTSGAKDYESGYEIGARFCRLEKRPDAIFAYKDLAALGFEQAVLEHGMKIPQDVAIVGYDNIESTEYAPVPLTTISQPTDEIGKLTTELLIQKIQGNEIQFHTILKPELIIRKSC
ncbi:substrate-binding domain-containing protein [candidate division KSB1 bacterium]|nr:substrate-binding domain-containing protein [candidate division KSB1 bacterium]